MADAPSERASRASSGRRRHHRATLIACAVLLVARALPASAICGDQIIDAGEQCETGPYGDAICVRACIVPGQPDGCTCATPPTVAQAFSVIAQSSVKLCADSKIVSGHVAVLKAGGSLTMGTSSKVTTDARVIADIVQMHGGATVGRVFANAQAIKAGVTLGDGPYRFHVPLALTPPTPRIADPGTTPRASQANEVTILPPGTYGTVTVFRGGTLRLHGTDAATGIGVYNIGSLEVQAEAAVVADNPVDMAIAGRMLVATRAYLGPATGAPIIAGDVAVSINGPLVRLGHLSRIRAHMNGAGTIRLGKECSVIGQVIANNVKVGALAQVAAEGGCGDGVLDTGEQCDASAAGGAAGCGPKSCVAAGHPGQCSCQ